MNAKAAPAAAAAAQQQQQQQAALLQQQAGAPALLGLGLLPGSQQAALLLGLQQLPAAAQDGKPQQQQQQQQPQGTDAAAAAMAAAQKQAASHQAQVLQQLSLLQLMAVAQQQKGMQQSQAQMSGLSAPLAHDCCEAQQLLLSMQLAGEPVLSAEPLEEEQQLLTDLSDLIGGWRCICFACTYWACACLLRCANELLAFCCACCAHALCFCHTVRFWSERMHACVPLLASFVLC
jgi:cytochrome bd-type quinol oxidase subunit 1